MSGPVPVGCAKNADYTERKKDRAENIAIFNPGEAREEERHGGEQNKAARCFGVHFPVHGWKNGRILAQTLAVR
jgi:hypothetical protein